MTSTRIVGLVRIGLVAASLAFAGGAALTADPASATDFEIRSDIVIETNAPSGPNFSSRCRSLKHLASGASSAGDAKQAHDFRQEAMDFGCL